MDWVWGGGLKPANSPTMGRTLFLVAGPNTRKMKLFLPQGAQQGAEWVSCAWKECQQGSSWVFSPDGAATSSVGLALSSAKHRAELDNS